MSERYFITGVQLGIIKAMVNSEVDDYAEQITKLIEEIEEDQFLGDKETLKRMKSK